MSFLATRGCHWHHDVMVAPPILVVQGLGCMVSKFGEDLSSSFEVRVQNVSGVSIFFGHHCLNA